LPIEKNRFGKSVEAIFAYLKALPGSRARLLHAHAVPNPVFTRPDASAAIPTPLIPPVTNEEIMGVQRMHR
jgi:hypothetical protein